MDIWIIIIVILFVITVPCEIFHMIIVDAELLISEMNSKLL